MGSSPVRWSTNLINEKNMSIKLLIEDHFGGKCPDDWDTNSEYKCTLSDIKQILEKIFNGFDNIDKNGADWNIWQNLKYFEKKEQSIWKTQSNLREIMLKVDLSKKERRQLEFVANQESSHI
jgi:hypothetical protein